MFIEINWDSLSEHYKVIPNETTIIQQDQEANCMYVLIRGSLAIIRNEIQIAIMDSSFEYIGEISFLTNKRHSATVISKSECTILELKIELFEKYLKSNANLTISIAQNLARRLVEQNAQLSKAMENSSQEIDYHLNSENLLPSFDLLKLKHLFKEFRPNVNFIEEGCKPRALYILVEGEISIIKHGNLLAIESTPGYYIGEVAILRNSLANASVRCNTPTTMIEIPIEKVEYFLIHSPEVGLDMSRKLAKRILVINDEFLNLLEEMKKRGRKNIPNYWNPLVF